MKYKQLLFCMLLLLLGISCSQEGEIREVATNYLKALVDYRLDDAKKFGDKSAVRFLETQQEIINNWTPKEREEARKSLENTEVKIINIDIKDTKAIVKYEYIQNKKVLHSESLYLIKSSVGWRVQESL